MTQTIEKLKQQGSSPARWTTLRAETLAALVVLLMGWQSPPVVASGLSESVLACAQEPDDLKRLDCYDNAVRRAAPLPAVTPQPAPAPKAAETASISTPTPPIATLPTAAPPTAAPPAAMPSKVTPPKSTELTASITHLKRLADGRYVITLDNGQTWLEAHTREGLSVNTGDNVTIRSEFLGAHYLRTPLGADVLVTLQP